MSYWLGEHGSCAVGEKALFKFPKIRISTCLLDAGWNACEVQNKVERPKIFALGEGEDADDEDYDYNLWHDFVGRNCEWDDDKDEDGGRGSSTNKQRIANPPSTFEDYVDEGRDYIGSSRISMENIEEASNNLGVKSSDQVADTKNHSDPNQEEDPSLDNSSQMLVLGLLKAVQHAYSGSWRR
ncbi:hypothetical protein Bca52824_060061 [Brassica carinata]|uniref:Uncharacterized protein n=1 Tax=Brassica carinata TaxID=52824 RepID=A0A8X7UIU0_BRACI|nr:hypothetical protein Bca52824_060061 [Brassica carinata]